MQFTLASHTINYNIQEHGGVVAVNVTVSFSGTGGEAAQIEFGDGGETISSPPGGNPKAYLDIGRFAGFVSAFELALQLGSITIVAEVDGSGAEIIRFSATP